MNNLKKALFTLFSSCMMIMCVIAGTFGTDMTASATQSRTSNFNKIYKLTSDPVENMVAVANKQLGKTGYNLKYSEEWCADFVCDVSSLANVNTKSIPYNYALRGGCKYLYNYMVNNCNATVVTAANAKRGDIIFFDWSGRKKNYNHVALVVSNKNRKLTTIGGNEGNGNTLYKRKVQQSTYSTSSKYICKIVRPNYGIKSNTSAKIKNGNTTYFTKYTGKSVSIVDALKAIKANSSFTYRAKIYAANGYKDKYTGSACQNTKLLSLLKKGRLIKP